MFAVDIEEQFFQKMRELIRAQEEACGKGIMDQFNYSGRVGEIRAYKKAINVMREIVKKEATDEELE